MDNPILDGDDLAPKAKPDPPARDADPGPPDIPGDEMARDARIWREYNKLAKVEDEERTRAWNRGLGGIGLFAGVFSGVTATFLTESYQLMQPDFTEYTYRTLIATATNATLPLDKDFVVPPSARVVNCLWIASLMFSLSAALIAVMGADWSAAYYDRDADPDSENLSARQRVERRQFRVNNVRKWSMPAIILTAPMLMQVSMLLFGIGLALFFVPIDPITQYITSSLAAVIVTIWVVTTLSPAFIPGSPFRSPLTPVWRRRLLYVSSWLYRRLIAAEDQAVRTHVDDPWMEPAHIPTVETLKSALRWLQPHKHLFPVLYDALGDLSLGPRVASAVYWRIADREAAAAIRAHSRGHHFRVVLNSSSFPRSSWNSAKAVIDDESTKIQDWLRVLHPPLVIPFLVHPPLVHPPLTEEYILARVIRGYTLDEIVSEIYAAWSRSQFPPVIPPPKWPETPPMTLYYDGVRPLHTTTLERLLRSEGASVHTAFYVLYIWRAQLVAHPGLIVEAMSALLDAVIRQPLRKPATPPQTILDHVYDTVKRVLHYVVDKARHPLRKTAEKEQLDRLLNKIFRRNLASGPHPLTDPIRMLCFIIDNHSTLELFQVRPSAEPGTELKAKADSLVPCPTPQMALEFLAYLCRHYPKETSVTQYTCVARTLCLLHPLLDRDGYQWQWRDVKFVLKRMPAPRLPARRLLRKSGVRKAESDPESSSNNAVTSITPSFLSHDVAKSLVLLLAPQQTWYLCAPTKEKNNSNEEDKNEADILLANICLRIAAVFQSAPLHRPVHDSVSFVLEELLSHGSLGPLIGARGNRLLDLIHALATFFAKHRAPVNDRLFLLFLASPTGGPGDVPRWRLEDTLPRVVIGGLLTQQKEVSKVLIALGQLRTRYTGEFTSITDESYWVRLAEKVYDEGRVLSPKTLLRHWKMLSTFYRAMEFVPPVIPQPSLVREFECVSRWRCGW